MQAEVVPNLVDRIYDLASDYDGSEDAESWLSGIRDTLGFAVDYVPKGQASTDLIEAAESAFGNAVSDMEEEWPPEPDFEDDRPLRSEPRVQISALSVFSDVDS